MATSQLTDRKGQRLNQGCVSGWWTLTKKKSIRNSSTEKKNPDKNHTVLLFFHSKVIKFKTLMLFQTTVMHWSINRERKV